MDWYSLYGLVFPQLFCLAESISLQQNNQLGKCGIKTPSKGSNQQHPPPPEAACRSVEPWPKIGGTRSRDAKCQWARDLNTK